MRCMSSILNALCTKADDDDDVFPICASLFSGGIAVPVQQRAFDDDEYDHQFWGWN